MKKIFQHRLPGFSEGRLKIVYMKLLQVRYQTGKTCRVCYMLRVLDQSTGNEGHQVLYGEIESNGGAEAKYGKALRQKHVEPNFGPAIYLLPEFNMVVWGFPNDDRLPGLWRLLDKSELSDLLKKSGHPVGRELESRRNIVTELVKYVPNKRCTLRHVLPLKDSKDLAVYSKTFSDKVQAGLTFKTMRNLWTALGSESAEIMIPEPLFCAPEVNTVFFHGLEGVNVDEHLQDIDLGVVAAAAGSGLARIHKCQIEGLGKRSEQHIMSKLATAEEILGNSDASYKPRVEAIIDTLWERQPDLPQFVPTPIHGAFRLSQLLLVENKIFLVDFDHCVLGNPISDVGNFVAHLLYLPLTKKLTQDESRSAIRHFCRAYAGRASWGVPADVLGWYTAAYLVSKQMKKCIKQAKKHSPESIDQLLNTAKAILDGSLSLI